MYILDVLDIQRHSSSGPAEGDLLPKQAEDRLRFHINAPNVK